MAIQMQPGGLPAGGYISPYANPVDYGYGKNFTPTAPAQAGGGMDLMTFLRGLFGENNPTEQKNPLNFALGDFLNALFPSGTSVREMQAAPQQNPLQVHPGQRVIRLGGLNSFSNLPPEKPMVDRDMNDPQRWAAPPPAPAPAPAPVHDWTAADYAPYGVTGLSDEQMRTHTPRDFAPGPHLYVPRNPLTGMRMR